jgi:hypothetical protein
MITSEERRNTGFSTDEDEKAEPGRPAPIDEDVEGELNAALPEPHEQEKERSQSSS